MMAGKEHQSPHPLAPAAAYSRSDMESAATSTEAATELRKKKRTKCLLYIVLFAIFQTGIILIFALTVMKIRTPKFRVRSATFDSFNVGTPANPSFNIRMRAELGVKNANFGRYKYQNTTVYFYYRGTPLGEALVTRSRASWRSTKKIDALVDLSLGNGTANSEMLERDLSNGVVPITAQARLRGRVELMFVMKKNRSANMNCTMEIVTATQQLQNIVCK